MITLGRHSYCHGREQVYHGVQTTDVIVGNFSSIASEVVFVCGGEHLPEWVSTSPLRGQLGLDGGVIDGLPATRGDIIIGSDVWIGYGALILSGAHIGHGAVVGAGAVVRGRVSPYSIVVGNPARELRRRFTAHQRFALLSIAWWDWPDEKIVAEVGTLCSANAEEFIARHEGE